MRTIAKWSVLTAAIATVALTNFEAVHPISHAAWFLAGAVWTLLGVFLILSVREHAAMRENMTPAERNEYDADKY